MDKCYICDAPGDTNEHVPPDAFFPPGYRENLVTVPSCPSHNLDNASDVEYVRNVIVSHHETNEVARTHFQGKVTRSYLNSPGLLKKTFQNSTPYALEGQETGIIRLDIARFNKVMEAIAYALHYMDFGKSFSGTWMVYSPSLTNTEMLIQGQPDAINEALRAMLRAIQFTAKPIPQPQVFKYGVAQDRDGNLMYRLQFYEGFFVNAVGAPKLLPSKTIVAI